MNLRFFKSVGLVVPVAVGLVLPLLASEEAKAGACGLPLACSETDGSASPNVSFEIDNTSSGTGIKGTSSSGVAITGVSSATSGGVNGVQGQTYTSGGSGVYGENDSTGGGYGVAGRTTATGGGGTGVYGQCEGTSGTCYGVNGTSSAPSGYCVLGQATTTASGAAAAGVYGVGTSSISTGGVPEVPAVQVGTGHAYFSGSNPTSTQGFKNTQTPKNIVKAWFNVATDGFGSGTSHCTVNDGFNITSCSAATNGITITFATAMGTDFFAVTLTDTGGTGGGFHWNTVSNSTGSTSALAYSPANGGGWSSIDCTNHACSVGGIVVSDQ